MKLKEGSIVRELGGEFVAVDSDAGESRFGGMLKMNRTAAFALECLREDTDAEGLAERLTGKYDVDAKTARVNVDSLIEKLRGAGLIQE